MATLNWIGKDKVINHHLDVPFRTLKHRYTYKDGKKLNDGTTSDNKIIHGDNLEALKSLLPEYEGRIKCIYIDPPYNTGNEGWVYNDNVNHPKIKKWLGEVVGKEGEDLTRHDKWLCMMYPRLKLLHKLLSDDGFLFVSIDDNEQANLKILLDELFGSNAFIGTVANISNPKGRSDDKYIATAHEYLEVYVKKDSNIYGWDPDEKVIRRYNKKDSNGKYREIDLRKTGSGDLRKDRPNMFYYFYYDDKNKKLEISQDRKASSNHIEIIPQRADGKEGRWRWGYETALSRIDSLVARVMPTRGTWSIFEKDYLTEDKRVKPTSAWTKKVFNTERAGEQRKELGFSKEDFETPKPVGLIEHIIKYVTPADSSDIILDSFAGSGTTAHAVLNLNKGSGGNRKFILVEMENYAEDVTAERVKRVINGYGIGNKKVIGTGGEFEYLELGDPLFNEEGYINENQPLEDIRKYVYYSETRTNSGYSDNPRNEYYLGKKSNTAYYFYYKKDAVTTLNLEFASEITIKADQYIVYADKCTLSEEYMKKHSIIFKKIPRDITKI